VTVASWTYEKVYGTKSDYEELEYEKYYGTKSDYEELDV
jgi:hypothetical protein